MKKISVIFAAMIAILCFSLNAYAEEPIDLSRNGSITFSMQYEEQPMNGGYLSIYQVGTIDKQSGKLLFSFIEELADSGLSLTNLNDAKLAEQLADLVAKSSLSAKREPIDNGKVTFLNLKPGLYLITQRSEDVSPNFYPINSFLISLPKWEDGTYIYDITGEPKNMPEAKPEVPDVPNEPNVPNEPGLPQTGQMNWPVPIMAIGGIAVFMLGCYLYFGKKDTIEK